MPRFEQLRDVLGKILQERPNCYWLYDQILNRLRQVRPDILEEMEKMGSKGYGRGGGEYYRPDNAIAHCLHDWPECVDIQYLSGQDLQIGSIKVSEKAITIYRWKE